MSTATCEGLEAVLSKIAASRLAKAGLHGGYASAKSELGERVSRKVQDGQSVYLWGLYGRGKTYAAAEAVRIETERNPRHSLPAKIVTAQHILDRMIGGDDSDFAGRLSRMPLLAIDDLGGEHVTDWSVRALSDLIDKRIVRGLPTIVTSNYGVGKLCDEWAKVAGKVAGERIASRLGGNFLRIEVTGEDRRMRCRP